MTFHIVAHHLQKAALKERQPSNDFYARSAFNRYYYFMYLTVRSMLSRMGHECSTLPHASVPEFLTGKVRKEFSNHSKSAQRRGDFIQVNNIRRAKVSLSKLSESLKRAKQIRTVADYRPEERVDFISADRFALRSIDVTEVHEWGDETRTLCNDVLSVWTQVHA